MLLVLISRISGDRISRDLSDQGLLSISLEALGSSLNDFVSEGLIEEEKVNSFNIPFYAPCPEEVSSEVGREGSFEILGFDLMIKSKIFIEEEKINSPSINLTRERCPIVICSASLDSPSAISLCSR